MYVFGSKWRIFVCLIVAPVLSAIAVMIAFVWKLHSKGVFADLPANFDINGIVSVEDNSLVYDRNGNRIGDLFNKYQVYVAYKDIPPKLVEAILSIEDQSFFFHKGYDTRGILRAAWVGLRKGVFTQGASTITQQLVRHLFLENTKSFDRKFREIALSYHFERRLTKQKIFELYCNLMFLGNGAYGVGAASERYFGRPLKELGINELALIAGLLQSPSTYNPEKFPEKATARQRQVLKAMLDAGYLNEEMTRQAMMAPIRLKPYRPLNPYPFFLDFVKTEAAAAMPTLQTLEGKGLRIHTTLDPELQKAAETTIANANEIWKKAQENDKHTKGMALTGLDKLEAAMVALDPTTGEILAMVGGRNYDKSQFNRITQSKRSPGSSFKPVIYSLALERGYNWNSVQYVAPVTVGDYRPRNMTGDLMTETTMLRSFYRSLNTPTVELASHLGMNRVLSHAKDLGILTPLKSEIGTALGGSEVTPFDMARVFSTFANEGRRTDNLAITRIENRDKRTLYETVPPERRTVTVLTPQVAFLMTEGLRTVLQHGTGFAARHLANQAVGKTGTSNGAKDNWFCGYTPNLVVIMWVGTDGNEALQSEAVASVLALPLWENFMTAALRTRPAPAFIRPSGIRDAKIHPLYGNRVPNGMKMYFLSGREPKTETLSPLQVLSEKRDYRRIFR